MSTDDSSFSGISTASANSHLVSLLVKECPRFAPGKNFRRWQDCIMEIARLKYPGDKILLGTYKPPTAPRGVRSAANSAEWNKHESVLNRLKDLNVELCVHIRATLDYGTAAHTAVKELSDAREVWKVLEKWKPNDSGTLTELHRQMRAVEYTNCKNISEFGDKLASINEQLRQIGPERAYSTWRMNLEFFSGLGESWRQWVSTYQMTHLNCLDTDETKCLPLTSVIAAAVDEEMQLKSVSTTWALTIRPPEEMESRVEELERLALRGSFRGPSNRGRNGGRGKGSNRGNSYGGDRDRSRSATGRGPAAWCDLCEMPGHDYSTCYRIVGYPDDFNGERLPPMTRAGAERAVDLRKRKRTESNANSGPTRPSGPQELYHRDTIVEPAAKELDNEYLIPTYRVAVAVIPSIRSGASSLPKVFRNYSFPSVYYCFFFSIVTLVCSFLQASFWKCFGIQVLFPFLTRILTLPTKTDPGRTLRPL